MKVLTAATLAVTTVVSLTWTGAVDATHGPTGTLCGMVSVVDQVTEDSMVGVVFGGPVVDDDNLRRRQGPGVTLVCTVQTNASTHTAKGFDVGGVTSKVTAAAAAMVNYYFQPGDNIYVCSMIEVSSYQTLYWDQPSAAEPGRWTTDPGSSCTLTTSVDLSDVKDTPFDDTVLQALRLAEPAVCAALRVAYPPDGDVLNVWDCAPYHDPTRRPLVGSPKRVDFALPPATDTP